MNLRKPQRRALLSWIFLGALFALCSILAFFQYRWSGEVSQAARDRLHGGLQSLLSRTSQGLNSDLTTAFSGLVPPSVPSDPEAARQEVLARFDQWSKTTRNRQVLRRFAMVIPRKQEVQLLQLDMAKQVFTETPWPAEWSGFKTRIEARLDPHQFEGRGGPGRGSGRGDGPSAAGEEFTAEIPLFVSSPQRSGPFGRRENGWLIVELNPEYLRETVLPEVVQRFLGSGRNLEYQVEVVGRNAGHMVIYQSDPRQASIISTADASANLFEPNQFLWQSNSGRGPGPGRGQGPDSGHWEIFVRHRAGSLEAVVTQVRWRNLGISAGVLLLIMATAGALLHFTRRTEKLAELQMDFVAGVSHELRTPLTVIHTAAYNLQGKMGRDPAQVEKYGALIQRESARLNRMVEQILRFASAEAGRVIQEREPLSIEALIEEAVAGSRTQIESSLCQFEQKVAPGLPPVLGDRVALRHALENLVTNALKYGLKGGNWIGIFAAKGANPSKASVEIRVADHGPGIPRDEQDMIFDPFFRGARAMEEQIHGSGLGLSLVKKIVEAHGGEIRVESGPASGTAFILTLPVQPEGAAG